MLFQFEAWLNNLENVEDRVTSGDKYFVRDAYQAKLRRLQDEGWAKQNSGGQYNEDAKFFDPELL